MPYTKTSWAAGNRVSIERLNKMKDGINAAMQKNATNQSRSTEVAGIFSSAQSDILQANAKVADAEALLETINPPVLIKDGWSFFDGASASSSTASSVTRTLSGFVTRAIDSSLFKNNGNNIEILQPGHYLVARSAKISGAHVMMYNSTDNVSNVILYGGSGSTYRTKLTAGFFDFYSNAPAGAQIILKVLARGNSSGMQLTFEDGKIAIKKVG